MKIDYYQELEKIRQEEIVLSRKAESFLAKQIKAVKRKENIKGAIVLERHGIYDCIYSHVPAELLTVNTKGDYVICQILDKNGDEHEINIDDLMQEISVMYGVCTQLTERLNKDYFIFKGK